MDLQSESQTHSVVSDSLQPHQPLDVHGILQERILMWARILAIPFFRGSSQPRDWTQVSRIAGEFFACWATREPSGPLGCLRVLDTVTCAATNVGLQIFLQDPDFNAFGQMPRSSSIRSYVSAIFNFWGPSILFSIAAVPFCIPTNSTQGCRFLHIFAGTFCLFENSQPDRCEMLSYCGKIEYENDVSN